MLSLVSEGPRSVYGVLHTCTGIAITITFVSMELDSGSFKEKLSTRERKFSLRAVSTVPLSLGSKASMHVEQINYQGQPQQQLW